MQYVWAMSPFVLLGLLVSMQASSPAVDRRPPVDQCASDPSFAAFRDGLRAAIARRDRDALLANVTDRTIVDYAGGRGRDDFAAAWRLDQPATSPIWDELAAALGLGCARDEDGSFWSPSLPLQLLDQQDVFMTFIALPGAELRAAPDPASPLAATLEWDILTLEEDDGGDGWMAVTLAGDRRGYVRRDQARAMLGYRAVFVRSGDRWVLDAFVAGD